MSFLSGRLFNIIFLILSFFISTIGYSKTLIVTDIDDTIKIAHVRGEPFVYAYAKESRFQGMSELLTNMLQAIPDSRLVYLSNANSILMGSSHRELLERGNFPRGELMLRGVRDDKGTFKQRMLRHLLTSGTYDQAILIGDNGEMDPVHYRVIAREFQNVRFVQMIHIVYSSSSEATERLSEEQVGYVTPYEIALELWKQHIVGSDFVNHLAAQIGPQLLGEIDAPKFSPQFFPKWMDCRDFEWKWEESPDVALDLEIQAKVSKRCERPPLFEDAPL